MTDIPEEGFMLGKFFPPQEGHRYLGDFATAYCRRLTIMVETQPGQSIDGGLRFEWMREMFPRANVVWANEVLPQDPSETQDFWNIWRDAIARHAPGAYDVVFASEHYGHRLAQELGARFVPVDLSRDCRPISGTAIRADPMGNWKYIPMPVRPYFCKRVVLFGPESSGKSTLATALGRHYDTTVVPEYGRIHVDAFGEPDAEGLRRIAAGHVASVAAAKRQANRILIEDTDPSMTGIWSEMLGIERDASIDAAASDPDLYVLCDVDIPWIDDGQRYFPGEADRRRFFDLCEAELKTRSVPYVVVRGSVEERMATAIESIDRVVMGIRP